MNGFTSIKIISIRPGWKYVNIEIYKNYGEAAEINPSIFCSIV